MSQRDIKAEAAIRCLQVAHASFMAAWPHLREAWEGGNDAARAAGCAIEDEFAKLQKALKGRR
jgi:hypothetical protein